MSHKNYLKENDALSSKYSITDIEKKTINCSRFFSHPNQALVTTDQALYVIWKIKLANKHTFYTTSIFVDYSVQLLQTERIQATHFQWRIFFSKNFSIKCPQKMFSDWCWIRTFFYRALQHITEHFVFLKVWKTSMEQQKWTPIKNMAGLFNAWHGKMVRNSLSITNSKCFQWEDVSQCSAVVCCKVS